VTSGTDVLPACQVLAIEELLPFSGLSLQCEGHTPKETDTDKNETCSCFSSGDILVSIYHLLARWLSSATAAFGFRRCKEQQMRKRIRRHAANLPGAQPRTGVQFFGLTEDVAQEADSCRVADEPSGQARVGNRFLRYR